MEMPDLNTIADGVPKAIVYCTGLVALLVKLAKKLNELVSILKKNPGWDLGKKSYP